MENIRIINVSVETFCGMLSVIFLLCVLMGGGRREKLDRRYMRMLICNSVLMLCDAAAWALKGGTGMSNYVILRAANFMVFAMGYVLLACYGDYMLSCIGTKTEDFRGYRRIGWALCGMALLLVIVSQFTNMYYIIDENHMYQRRALFWLSQIWGIVTMLLYLFVLIRYRKRLRPSEFVLLMAYIILPVMAMVAQIFLYGIALLNMVTTTCVLIIYMDIQNGRAKRMERQELELMESRIAIMLSQIQPHFLFNSLNTIHYLCDEDPAEAGKAVEHFAHYLRVNMDSLTKKEPIPLAKELEHVENYLNLEKLRFPEAAVEYELECTDIDLPPLSIQPLVENAIRHGIRKNGEGGKIVISTMGNERAAVITIRDNGAGFAPGEVANDGRNHIGIENVRSRVSAMCGGALEIKSAPGEGTVARLTIPK